MKEVSSTRRLIYLPRPYAERSIDPANEITSQTRRCSRIYGAHRGRSVDDPKVSQVARAPLENVNPLLYSFSRAESHTRLRVKIVTRCKDCVQSTYAVAK